jgi:hypothetical protein
VRRLSFVFFVGVCALCAAPAAQASECKGPAPCVDGEPLWLAPDAGHFAVLPRAEALPAGSFGFGASIMFRLRPAVVWLPAPNRDGREVNVLRSATDLALGWSVGLGHRLELSGATTVGLSQRGAGIKGVTDQAAPPLSRSSVHDPRVGLGYAFATGSRAFGVKARLELKLPLGDATALSGEAGVVTSPSLTLAWASAGFFTGAQLGLRLRGVSELFGSRVGSQGLVALGVGYAIACGCLGFTVEGYALPSLVAPAASRYLPAEWLASIYYRPRVAQAFSFGLGGGGGLPFSSDADGSFLAFGVPSFRGLGFARYTPAD